MTTRLRLGTKLGLLVVLPILVALAVGGPPLLDRGREWKNSQSGPTEARRTIELQRLLVRLENEEVLSAQFVATGDAGMRRQLATARPLTDAAARSISSPPGSTRLVRHAVADVQRRWRAVQTGRAGIDRRTIADLDATGTYAASLATTRAAIATSARAAARGVESPGLAPMLRPTLAALETATIHQQALLLGGIGRGSISSAVADAVRRDANTETALRDSVLEILDRSGNATSTDAAAQLRATARPIDAVRRLALARPPAATLTGAWTRATNTQLGAIRSLVGSIDRTALRRAVATRDAARSDLVRGGAIALGSCLVAFAIALVLRRAIIKPIRTVAAHADSVAHTLASADSPGSEPSPRSRPVRTADEIGAIDSSLRAIDRSAAETLSSQQRARRDEVGDLYVTFARRNQPLLRRQLDAIDAIAHTEPDADQLAAISTVEHLATRMQRNAESLLVLAGVDAHRSDSDTTRLLDIVSHAVSEVDQYERVDIIGLPPEVTVTGHIVSDLTHVVSELVENAVTYSAPDTRVFVSARRQLDGIEITISDEGIGITVDRLDTINEVLSHPPLPGLDLSRSLGVVVIARLCERIGAQVSLRSAVDVGTTATLRLPARLVVSPGGPIGDDDWVEPDDHRDVDRAEAGRPEHHPEEVHPIVTALVTTGAAATFANGSPLSPVITPTPVSMPIPPTRIPLPRRTPQAVPAATAGTARPDPPPLRTRTPQAVFELVARYESGTRRAARTAAKSAPHCDPTPAGVTSAFPDEGHPP